jgi:shikimate kinase
MIITLLGYMASGKSYVGHKLAQILDYKFIDLDAYIELKEQKSIAKIFKTNGEIYFRKVEHLYLKELLSLEQNCILSLGGGTPCYADNMEMLLSNGTVKTVYLNVSIPIVVKRLINETSKRPLISHLKTEGAITEFVGKHLFERRQFYNQAALNVDANKEAELVVEAIILELF